MIDKLAAQAVNWSDDELASRAVGLLILDKGNLNKYERTIWVVLQIFRAAEKLRAERKIEAHPLCPHTGLICVPGCGQTECAGFHVPLNAWPERGMKYCGMSPLGRALSRQ